MGFFSRNIDGSESHTIFIWKKNRWIAWQLVFFVIFSLVLHGSSFYLFQVAYPPPVRVEPEPSKITLLDDANPSIRQILQRVRDRTVYLRSPSEGAAIKESLGDHSVRFAPSFESIGPRFLPPEESAPELSSLFDIDQKIPEEGFVSGADIELSPSLSIREIAPWSILSDYFEGASGIPRFRASLSILPDGTVFDVSLGEEFAPEVGTEVAKVIESTLRFVPVEGSEAKTVEGWVDVIPTESGGE